MPRKKSPPELVEGPQAYRNFERLVRKLVRTPRQVLHSEQEEATTVVVEERTQTSPRRRKK